MSFGSNVKPKRFGAGSKKTGSEGWDCGCGVRQSKFVLFCKRCGKGQS